MAISRGLLVRIGLSLLLVAGALAAWVVLRPFQPPDRSGTQGEWTCSMHPQVRRSGPGQCPICGMDLVPVVQASQEQAALRQRAGIETESVTFRELFKQVRTVGKLDYNERQVAFLTARITGRVDRVYADFTGIQVKQGDHLVDIYSPDLVVTVQNLQDAQRNGNQDLARMARDRLLLWGMLPSQIEEMEGRGKGKTHLTIHAPIGGTVIEKSIRVGQYVKEGDQLYRIANLDPIWLYLDVYEYDLSWVRFGQAVEVAVEAFPGQTFQGTVTFIDPFLDDKTRTVKARVNLKNPERKLKPAMYASAVIRVRLRRDSSPEPTGLEGKYLCPMHPEVIRDQPGPCPICEMSLERVPGALPKTLSEHEGHHHASPARDDAGAGPNEVLAVPIVAVLDTGRRKVVYRMKKDGAYELVEVQVGPRAEGMNRGGRAGYFPVLSGLKAGDRVVLRGGFLLDSQRQIEGMPSLLYPEGQSAASLHSGHGGSAPPSKTPTEESPHKH